MEEHEFTLIFSLTESEPDCDATIEALSAKCDDALIGIGRPGRVALDFCREGRTKEEAMESAIADIELVASLELRSC